MPIFFLIQNVQKNIFLGGVPWGKRLLGGDLVVGSLLGKALGIYISGGGGCKGNALDKPES